MTTPTKPELTILDDLHFEPKLVPLLKQLRIKDGSPYVHDVERLLSEAVAIARPKAMLRLVYIEDKQDDTVVIDGITLKSRVLRVNMEHAQRALIYVATCGTELDVWQHSIDDMVLNYWADIIKEVALRDAIRGLNAHVTACYTLGKTATMNPGSLADWPIREQRPLFTLLGDPEAAIGVHLTESYLMQPNKSVSGIRFPTEADFKNCQLCPREDCPNRRALYDPDMYQRKYE